MTHKITIAYHSGMGHNKVLAEAAQQGVDRVNGIDSQIVNVAEMDDAAWERLDQSDAIIFGSPTYMGSVSGPFKMFMDETSGRWMNRKWQDKLAAGFTVSGSQAGDKLNTLSQLSLLAAQHGMLWISLGLLPGNNSSTGSIDDINRIGGSLGAMAQANADEGPDLAPPPQDRETAALLGERVATLSKQFVTRE